MAYLALYRKWRPRTFSEVVGQKHISIPLRRAIEQDGGLGAFDGQGVRDPGAHKLPAHRRVRAFGEQLHLLEQCIPRHLELLAASMERHRQVP